MALTKANEDGKTATGTTASDKSTSSQSRNHTPDPVVAPFTRQMSQMPPDKEGNAGFVPPIDHAPQTFDEVQTDGSVVTINADAKPYVKGSPLETSKNVASSKAEAGASSNNTNADNSNAGTRAELAGGVGKE